jgi:23S rRNA (guanosine2251-2'-O)-methyltransferase
MTEVLYGRHAILELLKANRRSVNRVVVAKGIGKASAIDEILQLASVRKIPVVEQPRKEIDKIRDHNQGVLAYCSRYPYVEFYEVIERVAGKAHLVTILLLDIIQDPQNLGTLLRTAEAVGVDGVIIPARRAAGVTPAVVRASAGACEHLWIAQHNLASAIKLLKESDHWIFGMEKSENAVRIDEIDVPSSLVLVVGAEGGGLRRLTREGCDQLIRLPMRGEVDSLNAAVAGSIALYFIWSSRGFNGQEFTP